MKITLESLKEYVQKSKLFAFPLMGIPKKPKVIETYFGINGLKLCDGYALVLLYHNEDPDYPAHRIQLEKNKFFDFIVKDEEFDIVVFDLSPIKSDYNRIMNGEYSKLSKTAKILVKLNNTDEKASMGINPEYYYKDLAELLQYPEECFENTEIISSPDMSNEILNVSEKVLLELKTEYAIPVSTICF
jgi:hypothetical protein